MKRYYELHDDMAIRGRWHLSDVVLDDGVEPVLNDGSPLVGQGRLVGMVSHAGIALDFCLTSFAVPVATASVARAIVAVAGQDLQTIPIEIAGQSAMVVLNSVRIVECLDEAESEFIKWTERDHRSDLAGQYRQVTRLTLARDRVPHDAHFFRVAGWTIALVVSDEVKEAMEAVGCRGAVFLPLPLTERVFAD